MINYFGSGTSTEAILASALQRRARQSSCTAARSTAGANSNPPLLANVASSTSGLDTLLKASGLSVQRPSSVALPIQLPLVGTNPTSYSSDRAASGVDSNRRAVAGASNSAIPVLAEGAASVALPSVASTTTIGAPSDVGGGTLSLLNLLARASSTAGISGSAVVGSDLHPLVTEAMRTNGGVWYHTNTNTISPGHLQPLLVPSSSSTNTTSTSSATANAGADAYANTGTVIRQEHINEALRSKPQRGRKRENLNKYERMELTRTRNREHAKSTRIRKKARYEELLEAEQRLQGMLNDERLCHDRRDAIQTFLSIREQVIRSPYRGDDPSTLVVPRGSTCLATTLSNIVDEGATFSYNCHPNNVTSSANDDNDGSHSRLPISDQLEQFDEWVVAKVTSCLGKPVIPMLSLSTEGGSLADGIAFNRMQQAFVQVSLTLATSLCLMRSLLRFDFAPASSRIVKVQWTTIHDATETGSFESIFMDDSTRGGKVGGTMGDSKAHANAATSSSKQDQPVSNQHDVDAVVVPSSGSKSTVVSL